MKLPLPWNNHQMTSPFVLTEVSGNKKFHQRRHMQDSNIVILYCKVPSDDDISTACMESLSPHTQQVSDKGFAESLLATTNQHISKEDVVRLKVRRSMIWDDAKMKLRRFDAHQSWSKSLKVEFVGEAAVVEGGPKQEFTSLVHKYVQTSMLFSGSMDYRCFSNNFCALQEDEYKLYGQFCAWTILQGCPSPSFFAPPFVDFILYGRLDKVQNRAEFVTEPTIYNLLSCFESLSDEKAFINAFENNMDICFEQASPKPK
eukprot:gene12632-13924_t